MIDINDYYVGLLLVDDFDTYQKNSRTFLYGSIYDPFGEETLVSLLIGVVTFLRKKDDIFYDDVYSRYKNELKFKLDQSNKGIKLVYVKKLIDCFDGFISPVYNLEELRENEELIEDAILQPYFITYSKLTREYNVKVCDKERTEMIRDEYFIKKSEEDKKEKSKRKK